MAAPAGAARGSPERGKVRAEWKAGRRYEYAVTLQSSADLAKGSTVDLDLSGTLELHARKVVGELSELQARLLTLTLAGSPSSSEQAVKTELEAPYYVKLEDGKVLEVRLRAGASPLAWSVAKTIAAALQFNASENGGPTWTSAENDATGAYVAEYRTGAELGAESYYTKRKLRYETGPSRAGASRLSSPLGGSLDLTPEIVSSTGEVVLDGSRLKRVTCDERLAVKLLGGMPITSSTKLALEFEKEESALAEPDWIELAQRTVAPNTSPPSLTEGQAAELDRERIGTITFEQAVTELSKLDKDQGPPVPNPTPVETAAAEDRAGKQRRFFTALTALFRRDPKAVTRAIQMVKNDGGKKRFLLDALASSTSTLAEKALVDLVGAKKLPPRLREAAASSLIRVRTPSEEAVKALRSLISDPALHVHAAYGLGTFSRLLRESGEAVRSRSIGDFLVERLAAAPSESEKVTVLRGIANSGDPGALSAVRPYLTTTDASLRRAGVEALRLMPVAEADALIAERLTSDEEPSVTRAALDSVSVRPASAALVSAVEKAAEHSKDGRTRMEAVRMLGSWLTQRPELKAALTRIAKSDAEENVRKVAEGVL